MPERKLILTHKGALQAKYAGKTYAGIPALTALDQKLAQLAAFDLRRNIETIVVYLDENEALGVEKVTNRTDERQFKKAIDKAYKEYCPNYMVILGAQDIVPFIVLCHPLHPDITDEDRYLPTDLPYACNSGYSVKFSNFINPTRIVSRIPDIYHDGDRGIQVLMWSLGNIMLTYTKDAPFYNIPWAACTCKRIVPMDSVLRKMYPVHRPFFYMCPPHDYHGFVDQYIRPVHFHILHGQKKSSRLFGEDLSGNQPVAVKCDAINQNINLGTIVLERACSGGQLYNPHTRPLPLVNMYLSSGAACVVGSTVSTYSDRYGLKLGDYLVAGFYNRLYGRTTGAAFLSTKQWLLSKLVDNHGRIDSGDIAMFASFNLYGDPSLVPMASRSAHIPQANYPPWQSVALNSQSPEEKSMEDDDSRQSLAYGEQLNDKDGYGANSPDVGIQGDEEGDLPDFKPVDMNLDGLAEFASDKECGFETDADLLLKKASYVMEFDQSIKISEEVKKQIEDYLDKTYQVKKVTAIYGSQIVKQGNVCKDKWQYTAYVRLPGFAAKDPPSEESDEPRQPPVLESWYVFEGDTRLAQFISAFEPN